jgi:hypothetical protein
MEQKNQTSASQPVPILEAEEVEQVIAPRLAANHNETLLEAEEIEQVIAPRLAANHNETFL